ncbi:hypothetical protein FGO68_gene11740 [Halteria grandinella]|uniref:Uncharacterized protein n=1 Tax=Halteria grandinella TaxID=5974 RepID=A0A8J8NDL4_HALGN|nr:hypothetical protein FGO68_gene11740 [Halteria grandinella]
MASRYEINYIMKKSNPFNNSTGGSSQRQPTSQRSATSAKHQLKASKLISTNKSENYRNEIISHQGVNGGMQAYQQQQQLPIDRIESAHQQLSQDQSFDWKNQVLDIRRLQPQHDPQLEMQNPPPAYFMHEEHQMILSGNQTPQYAYVDYSLEGGEQHIFYPQTLGAKKPRIQNEFIGFFQDKMSIDQKNRDTNERMETSFDCQIQSTVEELSYPMTPNDLEQSPDAIQEIGQRYLDGQGAQVSPEEYKSARSLSSPYQNLQAYQKTNDQPLLVTNVTPQFIVRSSSSFSMNPDQKGFRSNPAIHHIGNSHSAATLFDFRSIQPSSSGLERRSFNSYSTNEHGGLMHNYNVSVLESIPQSARQNSSTKKKKKRITSANRKRNHAIQQRPPGQSQGGSISNTTHRKNTQSLHMNSQQSRQERFTQNTVIEYDGQSDMLALFQQEIHNLRKQNAQLRYDKSKMNQKIETLVKEVSSLKALNKKTEQLRMREREYSSSLEQQIDRMNKVPQKKNTNKQV